MPGIAVVEKEVIALNGKDYEYSQFEVDKSSLEIKELSSGELKSGIVEKGSVDVDYLIRDKNTKGDWRVGRYRAYFKIKENGEIGADFWRVK